MALGALVLTGGRAGAHIEPDPNQVKPGERAIVDFKVEHGCGTSPTIKLTFQVPRGVTGVQVGSKEGWKGITDGKTVVFESGSLEAHTPDTFAIAFIAPKKKGVLVWTVIQDCKQGKVRWIDRAKGAENPPPVVGVGKKPPAD